uniref:TEPSIN adaptor related protein complex 4 accessory protein n=1 Tax=Anas platyrhynchos TaxID=8839 RepID=A0A8B9QWG0_ANAPL
MGSKPSPCSSLQGFGFSSERSGSGSAGEALLSTIQRAAEAVANAVLPTPEAPRPPCRELHEDSYQPVRAPSPSRSSPSSTRPPAATTAHSTRASHQPGLAGGGWEEADSGHSSQDSSQDNADLSRASDSYSKSGSDSHSGASRDLANGAERVDAEGPGDCLREVSLVAALTQGPRVFLSREEAQQFLKECGLLNCEVVLELLSRALQDPSDSVRMRSMCAISSLMCSDLLALDQIFAATQQHLQQLSQGSPGPVANRATKVTTTMSPWPHPSARHSQGPGCAPPLVAPLAASPPGALPARPRSPPLLPRPPGGIPSCKRSPGGSPAPRQQATPSEQEAGQQTAGGHIHHGCSPPAACPFLLAWSWWPSRARCSPPSTPHEEPRTLPQPEDEARPPQSSREPSAFSFLNV